MFVVVSQRISVVNLVGLSYRMDLPSWRPLQSQSLLFLEPVEQHLSFGAEGLDLVLVESVRGRLTFRWQLRKHALSNCLDGRLQFLSTGVI